MLKYNTQINVLTLVVKLACFLHFSFLFKVCVIIHWSGSGCLHYWAEEVNCSAIFGAGTASPICACSSILADSFLLPQVENCCSIPIDLLILTSDTNFRAVASIAPSDVFSVPIGIVNDNLFYLSPTGLG